MAQVSILEFDADVERSRAAAKLGPVIVTENERPSFVLLKFEDYERLIGGRRTMGEMLHMPGLEDVDFEPPGRAVVDREVEPDQG